MLSIFRRGAFAKVMLVVLAIGVFAIVITGWGTPGGIGTLGGGDTLASVEGETVTAADVADQANRQLARLREQQPDLDLATFLQGGAYQEIVDQLITQASLGVFGREQGLAASKRLIDAEIVSLPAFQNLAGEFDQATFRAALARERVSEEQLRKDLANTLIQRQLLVPVAAAVRVPQGVAEQYTSLLLEQRTGSVGLVPAVAMGAGSAPSDAQVAAFYKENAARYMIPERRMLRYALFGRDQVAGAARPTDAEIAAFYQANAATYGPRETRTLSQVVLPDQAAAQAFAARIAGGASFADAAQAAGFSAADTMVGERSKTAFAELTSAAVANAAFAAAEGAMAAPAQSALGWHVVRVDSINRQAERPLPAVRDEIAAQLGRQKAEEALGALVTRIEDSIAEGSSLAEVAQAERLTVQETPPITARGVQPGASWQPSPEVARLIESAFAMDPDDDPVVETVAAGDRYAVLAVGRVIPAAPPPLTEVRDRVQADLTTRNASERARAVASSIAAKINGGVPAARAFDEAEPDLPAVETLTARRIDIARPNQPVPPPLGMLFSLPQGSARILQAPNNQGWFVVHHERSTAGNFREAPALVQATRAQFRSILGDEYAAQFTAAIQKDLDIERNEGAIDQATTELTGSVVP